MCEKMSVGHLAIASNLMHERNDLCRSPVFPSPKYTHTRTPSETLPLAVSSEGHPSGSVSVAPRRPGHQPLLHVWEAEELKGYGHPHRSVIKGYNQLLYHLLREVIEGDRAVHAGAGSERTARVQGDAYRMTRQAGIWRGQTTGHIRGTSTLHTCIM